MAHTKAPDKINKSAQEIENLSFDTDFNVKVNQPMDYDPSNSATSNAAMVRRITPNLAIQVDVVDSSTTYIGKAKIGTATSAAYWQIFKISTSGATTGFTWADGNSNFDNIWDNRASSSYS